MIIYIPSAGRVGSTRTDKKLPTAVLRKYNAQLVVPAKEARAYAVASDLDVLGCPARGISATRQWILDRHPNSDELVLMLDDDLSTWDIRQPGTPTRYLVGDAKQITQAFADFEKQMRNHIHGAIGHRLFAQEQDEVEIGGRMLRALAYRPSALRKLGVKFRIPVMEDFDVQLQLLRKGYPNLVYYRMVQGQGASNNDGGCSTYRTPELQTKAAEHLRKLHPDFVKVVHKHTKSWKNGMEQRTDVKVAWQRALMSAVR